MLTPATRIHPPRILWCAFVVCALSSFGTIATCAELDVRLRITWGESTQRHWNGLIQLSDGGFSEVQHLGYEANAPTSVVNRGNSLIVWQPSPAVFDGIDVRVTASESATLTIVMQPDRNASEEQTVTFPLADFIQDIKHSASSLIDKQNNRVLVRRAPGDHLRIVSNRDSYVFAPGETWAFSVEPHRLPPNADLRCSLQLVNYRSEEEVWSEQFDVETNSFGNVTGPKSFSVVVPSVEGPYDLVATLRERKITAPALVQSFRERRFSPPVIYKRKVQLVVIDSRPALSEPVAWKEVDDVQPGNEKWWERWSWLPQLKLGNEPTGPLDNGLVSLREHLGQQLTNLAPGGWQAAPLPIDRVGAPHILEIEYPNDSSQTLAISVLETNAAGMVMPLGLDSGVDVVKSPAPTTPGMEQHRLIFWPKTKTPWLLLSNRRDGKQASFGKIRVLAGPNQLPAVDIEASPTDARMLAAYYDKPLFAENFSSPEALDEASQQSLSDWNTYYLGGLRLIEYLKHVGYNSAIISVSRDGATIYPSRLLDSTPRYDSGALFVSGQDLRQKDVLEMLFRLFDREQLKLIPAFHFATPLPELDAMRQNGDATTNGIDLVGFDGQTWLTLRGNKRGQAPYYNPLDSRVQNAVRHVVEEVVDRYSHHTSFGGVSLQLDADTFVQMPGTSWGNDDRTIARFKAETQSQVLGTGPGRFKERSKFLSGKGREAWLNWRAEKLTEFYAQIQRDVARSRPDAQLFLATSELLESPAVKAAVQPRLPLRADAADALADAMLQLGLDAEQLQKHAAIVVLRPQRAKPVTALADQAVDMQLRNSEAVDSLFNGNGLAGSLSYHEPLTFAVPTFDAVSPFGAEKTRIWSAAHIPSNGYNARSRFIQNLASLDAQVVAEGGWMMPLGQEDSLRKQFAAFRQLPAQKFETVEPQSNEAKDSFIVIRKLTVGRRTYFYVVNNAPWAATAHIQLTMSQGGLIHQFGTDQPQRPRVANNGQMWDLELDPYDLVVGYFNDTTAEIVDWRVSSDSAIVPELRTLVTELKSRVHELRTREPLKVVPNPGFEQTLPTGRPTDWEVSSGVGVTVNTSTANPHRGSKSLHMKVTNPRGIAWARTPQFEAPTTGRLSLLVWARTPDDAKQPRLRLSIDTGRGYYEFAPLGVADDGTPAERLSKEWPKRPYLFHYDTLPADLGTVAIGFDLLGEGEVWIDDVEVYDLYFFETELNELSKNVGVADFQLDQGRIGYCERFLEGYWPRFVIEHVPPARVAMLNRPGSNRRPAPPVVEPTTPAEEKPSGLRRYLPSLPFKFPFSNDN